MVSKWWYWYRVTVIWLKGATHKPTSTVEIDSRCRCRLVCVAAFTSVHFPQLQFPVWAAAGKVLSWHTPLESIHLTIMCFLTHTHTEYMHRSLKTTTPTVLWEYFKRHNIFCTWLLSNKQCVTVVSFTSSEFPVFQCTFITVSLLSVLTAVFPGKPGL